MPLSLHDFDEVQEIRKRAEKHYSGGPVFTYTGWIDDVRFLCSIIEQLDDEQPVEEEEQEEIDFISLLDKK